MVRRLKGDLRQLGAAFPERSVAPIRLSGLPEDAPELRLATMLADYGALREQRIGTLSRARAAQARLAFVGLQQRLLSSIPAFARTLAKHLAGLDRLLEGGLPDVRAMATPARDTEVASIAEEAGELVHLEREDDLAAEAAATLSAEAGERTQLEVERAHVAAMLALAEATRDQPDARIVWLEAWIREHMLEDGRWNERRLLLFTEYETTRLAVQRQLGNLLSDLLDRDSSGDARIDSFTGVTSTERRESLKRSFNSPSAPLRILICTDAAREGINLQAQCHDLIHLDLPWNPSRLEQRNGRIDRKLQPSPIVHCRYFLYEQRPEDVVLDALVRKTELIHRQLGSAGQVLEARIADRLERTGIRRAEIGTLAERIRDEEADERVRTAVRDLDDVEDRRLARLRREEEELGRALERARARVGVQPEELREVIELALGRTGATWANSDAVGEVSVLRLDPKANAFERDASWRPVFDELRSRPRRRGESPAEWRDALDAQVRRISFAPAVLPDGRDAGDVVQVHLEHRLVRRLLARFLSAGFQGALARACVLRTRDGGPARVVLIGRLALYGEGAQRLHEELVTVTAEWRDRNRTPGVLRALAESGEADARALDRLFANLSDAANADEATVTRLTTGAAADVMDLRPVLEGRAKLRADKAVVELAKRGEAEARDLERLLTAQIDRIRREQGRDDSQLAFGFDESESRQRAADRRSWDAKVTRLDDELIREPERLRRSFDVKARRVEPVGIVYLWPEDAA